MLIIRLFYNKFSDVARHLFSQSPQQCWVNYFWIEIELQIIFTNDNSITFAKYILIQ